MRHILKSVDQQDDRDVFYSPKNHPFRFGKKFHLAKIENRPNGYSSLRKHNSEGDEIERIPDGYREDHGVLRSYTSREKGDESAENIWMEPPSTLPPVHHYGGMNNDILHRRGKSKHRSATTEGDLDGAIILTAKDDGDSQNIADDSADDDITYRRTLGSRHRPWSNAHRKHKI